MAAPKILIVDDEVGIRRVIHNYLSNSIAGEFMEAANAYEAIEQIKANAIDLLLLDIKMPGLSGREVIPKVREISPQTAIIVITKWDSAEVSQEVMFSGADYIPKPFSLKIVLAKVEEKLRAKGKFLSKQPG